MTADGRCGGAYCFRGAKEVEIDINWRRLLRDAHIYRHIVTKIMDAIVGLEEKESFRRGIPRFTRFMIEK